MLESAFKTKAKKKLAAAGWKVIHLIQTNNNGIPDTLIIRKGVHIFIEFKRPGEVTEEDGLQQYRAKELRSYGSTVIECNDLSQIQHLF